MALAPTRFDRSSTGALGGGVHCVIRPRISGARLSPPREPYNQRLKNTPVTVTPSCNTRPVLTGGPLPELRKARRQRPHIHSHRCVAPVRGAQPHHVVAVDAETLIARYNMIAQTSRAADVHHAATVCVRLREKLDKRDRTVDTRHRLSRGGLEQLPTAKPSLMLGGPQYRVVLHGPPCALVQYLLQLDKRGGLVVRQ